MHSGKPRVVFYALRDLHVPVLLPVYHAVAEMGACEIGFAAPPYQPGTSAGFQEGLSDQTRAELRDLAIPFWGHTRQGRYDCVVVADACYDRVDGWGPAVCVGHGTIGKGFYFTSRPVVRRENFARVLCVPGPWYVTSYGAEVFTRVVPTGFSKMDELAAPSAERRLEVLMGLGLDPGKRTILFAPTFNRELTSLAMLFKTWETLDSRDDQVIFKLHGATDEAWMRRYRALAARAPHLHYAAPEGSLSPYLLACDVIVSDVSSAYVEGLVTGKPIIVVNNPEMAAYPHAHPEDVEYQVRDAAYQVRDGEELRAALARLREEDPLAGARADYAERLFAPQDGGNSARIAVEIAKVVTGERPHALPRSGDRMAVYLPADVADPARLEIIAANIARAGSALTVFSRNASGPATIAGLAVRVLGRGQLPPQPFICMTGAFEYPDDWDVLWFMASHVNPGVEGVFGPTLPDREAYGPQRHTVCFTRSPALPDAALQAAYKYQAYGQLATAPMLAPDGAIVSRRVPRELALRWIDHLARPASLASVGREIIKRGMFVGILPAFFAKEPTFALRASARQAGPVAPDSPYVAPTEPRSTSGQYVAPTELGSASGQYVAPTELGSAATADPMSVGPCAVSRPPTEVWSALRTASPHPAADLLFYAFKNVHLPIFAPVIAAVRDRDPQARIRFTAPPLNTGARQGLTDQERARFAADTGAEWVSDAACAEARVAVMADCVADRLRGARRIVNLGHGLISKGQYFGPSALIGRENLADAICVPGPWHAERLSRHLYIPIHTTGMSKLDGLFTPFDDAAFRAANGLPAGEPIILWCPTFNMELSSLPVIGAEIRRLTPFGHVVIKMHGTTDPAVAGPLRDALGRDRCITMVDPARDATPFMRCASLLVTDVSSVMFEFAALDRPVVLVDNPRQAEYRHYDPRDVEYVMRDLGARVRTVDELVEAVRAELAEPAHYREARRRATTAMFAATDGRNADRISRVLMERPARPPWMGPFDVVLPQAFTATDLAFSTASLRLAANVIGPARIASAPASEGLRYRPYTTSDELAARLGQSQSDHLLVFGHRARLIGDWRPPLFGPLYAHRDAPSATAPLSTADDRATSHVSRHLKWDRVALPPQVNAETLASVLRLTNPGEWTPVSAVDSPVLALRRATALSAGGQVADWGHAGAVGAVLVGDALACE